MDALPRKRLAACSYICYKSFVRPILEYCSSVWSPHIQSDIIHIQSHIQSRWKVYTEGIAYTIKTLKQQLIAIAAAVFCDALCIPSCDMLLRTRKPNLMKMKVATVR